MLESSESNDLPAMLNALPDGAFQSELRLFAVQCASRVLRFLPEQAFTDAILASENFARNGGPTTELQRLVDAASALLNPHVDIPTVRDFAGSAVIDAASVFPVTSRKAAASASCAIQAVACAAADAVPDDQYDLVYETAFAAESSVQCELLRSIFSDQAI